MGIAEEEILWAGQAHMPLGALHPRAASCILGKEDPMLSNRSPSAPTTRCNIGWSGTGWAAAPDSDLRITPRNGAGCRNRTRDIQFTKLALYQLS
jgi:hypothetical protein